MIIQEHDRLTFAVDTAHCWGDNDYVKHRCLGRKVQKVHRVGKDMVFIAGMTECIEQLKGDIHRFVNEKGHINIELLKQYLKREFPKEKSKYSAIGLSEIGATVLAVNNGESIVFGLNQDNNFEPVIFLAARNNINLVVDGFDNKKIYNYALRYLKGLPRFLYTIPNTFINVYQNNYSEGVGGYIQIYTMNSKGCNMVKEHKLKEENLRYAISQKDIKNTTLDELKPLFQAHITASQIHGGIIEGTDITGVTITGGTINGARFVSDDGYNSTVIDDGKIETNFIVMKSSVLESSFTPGGTGYTDSLSNKFNTVSYNGIQMGLNNNINAKITPDGEGKFLYLSCPNLNGYTPITSGNIGSQSVANAATANGLVSAGYPVGTIYVSTNNNLRPVSALSGYSSCGTSEGLWSSVWAVNGTIQTSDERQKANIKLLAEDERFLRFAKMITPYIYQMVMGTSGRWHVGFIAQRIEEAMLESGISSTEFAGLVKAPVYAEKLKDENGNELDEYDTTSEIIDYTYHLRYEEFIPLLLLRIKDNEERLHTIEEQLNIR
jgi:hypothetical protein